MGEAEVDPATEPPGEASADETPPFGSWARTYTLTISVAILCMALLYWLTWAWNIG